MAFKKPADKHTSLKRKGVVVKNSYYTFAKDYPVSSVGKHHRSNRKRNGKKNFLRAVVLCVCFALIAAVAYFVSDLCIKISYKPTTEQATVEPSESENESQTLLQSDGVRAFYMPAQKLGDTEYIKSLIKLIRRRDCNSVVIDFKTNDGHLAYSSSVETAMVARAALFDNETVRTALALFKNKNIKVIAQIYCFEDNLIASSNSDFAVKYLNSDVTWLDSTDEQTARAWLNPYSKEARKYLRRIISEVTEFSVSGIILKSVSFPSGGATDAAGYDGEKSEKSRNKTLLSFVESVKKALPSDVFLLTSQSANDTLEGNTTNLFGSFNSSKADGVCVVTVDRPSGYAVDKKTKFSSILSLFSKLNVTLGENAAFVAQIDGEEYSSSFLKAISKAGYKSFVVFDEEGRY